MKPFILRAVVFAPKFYLAIGLIAALCLVIDIGLNVFHYLALVDVHTLEEAALVTGSRPWLFNDAPLWLGFIELALLLATQASCTIWVFASVRLLLKAGVRDFPYTPWFAALNRFVPIVSLYMPMLCYVEMARAMPASSEWRLRPPSQLAALCGAFSALAGIFGKAALVMSDRIETLKDMLFSAKLDIASNVTLILSVFLTIALMRSLAAAQREMVRNLDEAIVQP
jgi:hypothetical protein